MPHTFRIVLLIGAVLLSGRADAQADEPTPEMLREWAIQDSLRANWDAEARRAASFHVVTVRRQGDGFVYDAEDSDEDVIRLWTDSPIIVRTPGIGRTMVVVEPAGTVPATRDQNAFTIPPDRSLGLISTRGAGWGGSWFVTHHAVRILVCTEAGPGSQCRTWTEARPQSGGAGLTLTVVGRPEAGGYMPPAPMPHDGTGGSSGGSGTARPNDDGNLSP